MKTLLTLLFAFITTLSIAQSKTFKATPAQTTALKVQAEACADAMMKQNYKQMAYYTYPPIVKMMGGAEQMEKQITKTMGQMQANGVTFKSVTIGEIKEVTQSKGDLYSIVQDILQLSMNGTVITRSSYLLAYSHDNGKRWYFVDTAPMKNQNMKKMFPTYPPGFVIPQAGNPVMGN
ncbi:MAG: hypothetical protein ABIN91_11440 [Mucilaginibacter sp.]|uniref:hypothetical protein n=1 Tax=Mucilaginibacter sp. TaxID=1882438 RepID=UPI00326675FA